MNEPLTISTRQAAENDVEFLVDATEAGRAAIVGVRGGDVELMVTAPETTLHDRYIEALSDQSQGVVVGLVQGVPVGFTRVEAKSTAEGSTICHVHELYVFPDARGVGVGALLLLEIKDFGRAHECVGIDARALPGDRNTKNFFESFGLVARSLAVHAALD